MKTILLLFVVSFLSYNISGQVQKKITYLTISIKALWDKKMQRDCYRIFADSGNPYAQDVYDLVWFYSNKTPNQPANFFDDRSDTATVFYNYFNNRTSALRFMGDHGWELVSVSRVTNSDYENYDSSPLYYFKKFVE